MHLGRSGNVYRLSRPEVIGTIGKKDSKIDCRKYAHKNGYAKAYSLKEEPDISIEMLQFFRVPIRSTTSGHSQP